MKDKDIVIELEAIAEALEGDADRLRSLVDILREEIDQTP